MGIKFFYKRLFLIVFLFGFTANILADTFDFESDVNGSNTDTVTQTISDVKLTVTTTANTIGNTSGGGYGGSTSKMIFSSSSHSSTDYWTVSFDTAVDVTSLVLAYNSGQGSITDITFSVTDGSANSDKTLLSSDFNSGSTVALNWTGVTSFKISGAATTGWVFDTLIFSPILNNAPTISGTSSNQAVDDNVTSPITPFSSVTLDDNESDDINVTLSLDDNNKGTLSASTISTGTIASVQSSLRAITFTPAQNRVAPGSTETTTITVTINDGTSSTNDTNTTIVSTSINDAPSNSFNTGVNTNEDTQQAYKVSDLTLGTDPEGNTVGIAITSMSGNGTWQFSHDSTDGSNGTWTNFDSGGSLSSGNALLLISTAYWRYVPDNKNGESVSFSFHTWDQTSGTASSGTTARYGDASTNGGITAYSSATATMSITVSSINDAPTASSFNVNINEDGVKTFALSDFNASDVDSGDSVESIIITSLPNKGTLQLSDVNVSANQTITTADITNLKYTPVANGNGTPYTTFGFKANDGDANSSEYTATINITAINDTPIITSNGSGDSANINVVENNTAVTTVTSSDADSGDTKTYSITGGADSGKFDINSSTGVLTFSSAPNYESPTDSGSDNTYVAIVQVADANGSTDTQTLNVSVTNNTNEAPSVSLSINNSNVAENGGTSIITATLSEAVSEDTNVTIGLKSGSSASSSDFNLSSTTITINANSTTGTAIFTSLDDLIDDDNEIATIEIVSIIGGENAVENGTQESNIIITNDDSAGITLSKTTASVDENGSTDSFTIKLDTQPTGDVIIDFNSSDTSEATISPSTLTFTSADWNTTQTVTITGVDDNIVDGDINSTITVKINTSDSIYNAISNKTVIVTTNDDDNAGYSLSKTTASVDENGTTDTFTVVLDKAPTSNVVISVTSSDTTEATVSQSTLTFTTSNWDTNQTVTITGVDDSDTDGSVDSNITLSVADASSNDSFDPLVDQIVTVTTNDDDNQLPVITQGSSTTVNMSEDGNPTAFSLTLNATDGDNDTLTWSIETNATNGSASVSGTGNAKSISYNPNSNYNGSDSFVVKVEDTKNGSDTITVNVNIASINDLPLINTIFNNVSMNEDNGTTSYDVNISDLDNTDLNLTIESNNTSIMTVSSNFSSDINSSTYANLLDFNLTTVDNANGMVKITLTLSDGEANATTSFDVNISAVNDTPIINTVFNDISMNEDNGTTSYDINISDVDFTDLNLTVESNNTSLITVNPNFSSEINSSTYASLLDFNLTTVNDANGIAKITLTLTDGELNVTKTFDVNISAVNDVPVIETNLSNIVKDEDSASLFISLNTTDIDSNESSVVYSASSSDTSIATVQVVNGVLIVTPKDEANGEVTIDVNATVDGQTVTQTFTYTLNSINDRPNIAHLDDIFLDENGSVLSDTINFTIYDDVNITSWEVKSSNQNLLKDENLSFKKVSDTNASLSYAIGANKTGKTKVKVTVKDDENLSYSELFYITVARSNDEQCVENTKTALTFNVIKNANISQKYITDDLRLVDTMRNVCSAKIKWNSSKSTVIGNDGVVNIPASDTTLALTATISKGAESTTKQFLLTVVPLASNISDAEAVSKVTFQDIKNTNRRQDQIVADLTLVSSSLGKDINWSSTDVNSTIIDLYTFKVTRPDSNGSDTNVTLTATIGDSSKEFNLTVIAMPNNTGDKLANDKGWLNFARILDKNRDNNNVIYDLVKPLPSSSPNGSTISWETSNSDVITTDGDVTRSSTGDRYVTMTATFINSGITDTKEFLLRVLENKTTTSNDVNVSFEQVIDNNETGAVAVSFKEDGEDANTTASFDDSLVSKLEKIISDDSVQSIIELADKIINLFLNTDGTAQSQAEFTNDNNESVISSIKIDSRKSSTNVDENGTVVSTVALDATTTLKAELNSDGSVSHTVEANGGSSTKTTKASSSIPGSQVQADNAGNVETTSEIKSGNFIYKAVASSDKDGKTKTKFITINLSTGEETTVDNILNDSTPYATGNTVEISELDGNVLYIKTTAPLDGNLSVK